MSFSAKDVAALRERTGAGMLECKKALTETGGDAEKALDYLRERGLAAAAKKAGRIAAEGLVYAAVCDCADTSVCPPAAVIIEVNIETDFAAKNEKFVTFIKELADIVLKQDPADVEALMACKLPSGETVTASLQEKILTIGENIQIRRFERIAGGVSVPYIHMGGKIGVLLNMEVSENLKGNPELTVLGRDIAMQIAAMRPQWLAPCEVDDATLAKERQILLAQALGEGKPQAVAEKMVDGRIRKFFEEFVLLNQPFVKENKRTVSQHLEQTAKELGGSITLLKFVRYERGEGIAKKEDNFADEVANMVK
jgi:elongation factor Ts